MSNLYKDAIADARKLREAAEQNAKNRIIEAVTPKLRQLIERQIAEGSDELIDDENADSELLDAETALDMMDDDSEEPAEPESMELTPEPVSVDTDGLGSIEVVPDEEADITPLSDEDLDEEESEEKIEDESQNKSVHVNITVEGRRNHLLRHRAIRLVKALSEAKSRAQRNKIRKELRLLREALIITENSQNVRLAKNIKVILKESTMRRRRNSWLFEGKDEAGAEDVEFEDAGFDEGDIDADAVQSAVQDLAAAVGMEVSGGAGEDDLDMEDDEDLDMDDDLDMEDDEDLDLEETYEMAGDEYDEMMEEDELDQCETDELMEGDEADDDDDDEVVEVNESMLRRALGMSRTPRRRRRSSRRVNESRRRRMARRRRYLRESEAKDAAGSFGGGKVSQEVFVEVDENTLLNALAEELGDAVNQNQNTISPEGGAPKMASNFGGGAVKKGVVPESRRRRRNTRLSESRKVRIAERKAIAAKKELKESNLMNAKLLYVTKLMQQHTLNNKQQRAIIEAMDNAKTQREAKLLFTSLTESLNKRAKGKSTKSLNESASRTGTSSRSLRSGQAPRNNGVELDRWAVLAGLKK